MLKRNILLSTALAASMVGLAHPTHAQQAGGVTVGEVVVTAQRRTERLVDVPMTVAVVTGAQLTQRGIQNTQDLQRSTAGLQMTMNGSFLAPSIRGISANTTNAGIAANVAFYLDGIYQPSQFGGLFDLPDIQDIEVLKGPQGTLYGQNAEGGAIVVNTLEPKFKWQGKANVSYGNYNAVRAVGFETGPLTDAIAQSVSAAFDRHDGFYPNVVTGKAPPPTQSETVRAKMLFQPNDKEKITVAAYYDYHNDPGIWAGVPFHGLSVATQLTPAKVVGGYDIAAIMARADQHHNSINNVGDLVRDWGADIKGDFDMGLGKLTLASAFADTLGSQNFDTSYSPLWIGRSTLAPHTRDIIEQGDFVSRPIGPVEFSTGLFYEHLEEQLQSNRFTSWNAPYTMWPSPAPKIVLPPGGSATQNYQIATRDVLAGYLEGTFHVTSDFVISVGGRYSTDTMHAYFNGNAAAGKPNSSIPPTQPGHLMETELYHSPASWVNFAPRVTARYKITPTSNVYFTYSEGYRSGTLNATGLTWPVVKPEILDSYEVGYKGTLFNQLSIALSGFYYEYKDKQEMFHDFVLGNFIQNAASAVNDGIDLDATWVASRQLAFNASVEWLEATFGKYPASLAYLPYFPAGTGFPACGVAGAPPATNCVSSRGAPGGLTTVVQTLSHRQEGRAPKWSGTVGADYHVDTQYGRFTANASVYYTSSEQWDENATIVQPAYADIDAEIGFTPVQQPNMRFVLWGKNLTDAGYFISSQESGTAGGVTYGPPRQYGVRLEMKF